MKEYTVGTIVINDIETINKGKTRILNIPDSIIKIPPAIHINPANR